MCACAKGGMTNGMCEYHGECVCRGDSVGVGLCVLARITLSVGLCVCAPVEVRVAMQSCVCVCVLGVTLCPCDCEPVGPHWWVPWEGGHMWECGGPGCDWRQGQLGEAKDD